MDLVKILEKVPVGTPLYSMVDGTVYYKEIEYDSTYPIICIDSNNNTSSYTTDGKALEDVGECILFPSKDNRDWNNFPKAHFKPFDKVLVRDSNDVPWQLSLFAFIDKSNPNYQYCVINGMPWKQCILYEGNEHLLGRVKEL